MRRFLMLVLMPLLHSPETVAADKTDLVYLKNGDRITGEVVKLEAGVLEFKTDTMGNIFIEWRFIDNLVSNRPHAVEGSDGSRWLGSLAGTGESGEIEVSTPRGPVDLSPQNVVSVWPVATVTLAVWVP